MTKRKPETKPKPKPPRKVVKFGPQKPEVFNFRIAAHPKERQRSMSFYNKRTGKAFSKHYTPKRTQHYEQMIREATALQYDLVEPYTADLYCIINFRVADRTHGDIDNLIKSILDGMQGVAYKNDKQIKKLDSEVFFPEDDSDDCIIEVILMRHRPRPWIFRLCLAVIEFFGEDCPF